MRSPHSSAISRPWLAAIAAGSLSLTATAAEESDRNRLDRLGFHFDQKAHDAAVAAEEARIVPTPSAPRHSIDDDADVVHLPLYVVEDKRIRLADHEVLTKAGRVEVAKKRYLSPVYQKTLGPLSALAGLLANPLGGWNPNAPEAMVLYEQDEQIRRNTALDDLQEMEALRDSPTLDLPDSSEK